MLRCGYCTGLKWLKVDLVGMLHFSNNLAIIIHAIFFSHNLHIVNKQLVAGGVILNNNAPLHQD